MEKLIQDHFVPVKIHMKEQPQTFDRFGVQWTPTLVVFDPDGHERRRFEGYMPADEFLGRLELALGHVAFAGQRWSEAERWFRHAAESYPRTEAAAEALYWAGVSRYKGGDQAALPETARRLSQAYPQSSWTTRASVWAPH